jgi:ABC-2 type transport system ATP-binding protein
MNTVIDLKNLVVDYGGDRAVNGLSLEVKRGQIFGLLGHNGSGKSTTIRVLAGLLPRSQGSCLVFGLDPLRDAGELNRLIGVMPDNLALFENLSVGEHLELLGRLHGLAKKEADGRAREILAYFDFLGDRDKLTGELSFGTRKKLGLALALIHAPELLILDEPFEGLDPVIAKTIKDLLLNFRAGGKTIFIASHYLDMLEKIIDGYAILKNGSLACLGSVAGNAGASLALEENYLKYAGFEKKGLPQWIK